MARRRDRVRLGINLGPGQQGSLQPWVEGTWLGVTRVPWGPWRGLCEEEQAGWVGGQACSEPVHLTRTYFALRPQIVVWPKPQGPRQE